MQVSPIQVNGTEGAAAPGLDALIARSNEAATFLKALGHDGRLMILCHLRDGPKSVTELENLLSARQAVVSQQLARLRLEGLVSARREGQAIYYSILDPRVGDMVELLARMFCDPA
jgi:ArsR family transcriptional regulator